ncbi:hypothetical protein jhhlp_000559 [Lomentospora prolificans]|uniref:Uncharacterized protein n=1 Tax=Lomentospora prolificans TaxID=41688 RepID=A0A2N3NL95_9PEZI|nr:hypothetical protein jhhlp_000559 [Lomentospora prolificans]
MSGESVTLLTKSLDLDLVVIVSQRLQLVQHQNPLMAGVKLLPLLGACAIGSFTVGVVSSRQNNTSYTLILSSTLQFLGSAVMTRRTNRDLRSSLSNAHGALSQARLLEGCLGISICKVIRHYESGRLTNENVTREVQGTSSDTFSTAFAMDVKIMMDLSIAMVLLSVLSLERKRIKNVNTRESLAEHSFSRARRC